MQEDFDAYDAKIEVDPDEIAMAEIDAMRDGYFAMLDEHLEREL